MVTAIMCAFMKLVKYKDLYYISTHSIIIVVNISTTIINLSIIATSSIVIAFNKALFYNKKDKTAEKLLK